MVARKPAETQNEVCSASLCTRAAVFGVNKCLIPAEYGPVLPFSFHLLKHRHDAQAQQRHTPPEARNWFAMHGSWSTLQPSFRYTPASTLPTSRRRLVPSSRSISPSRSGHQRMRQGDEPREPPLPRASPPTCPRAPSRLPPTAQIRRRGGLLATSVGVPLPQHRHQRWCECCDVGVGARVTGDLETRKAIIREDWVGRGDGRLMSHRPAVGSIANGEDRPSGVVSAHKHVCQ